MAKDINVLKDQAIQIRDEVEDGRNTAKRIGGMFSDLVDKVDSIKDEVSRDVIHVVTPRVEEAEEKVNDLGLEIGKFSSLATENKDNLVSALNGVYGVDTIIETKVALDLNNSQNWEQGSINASTGEDVANTSRLRTKYIRPTEDAVFGCSVNTSILSLYLYDKDKVYIADAYQKYLINRTSGKPSFAAMKASYPNVVYVRVAYIGGGDASIFGNVVVFESTCYEISQEIIPASGNSVIKNAKKIEKLEGTVEAEKVKLDGIEEGAEKNDANTDDNPLADLSLEDENGNIILELNDGHIKTKYFDSRKGVSAKKKIYLVGDSITQGSGEGLYSPITDEIGSWHISDFLQEMCGDKCEVINLGCGGEVSGDILMRMGWCTGILNKEIVLKGDGSEVEIFNSANNGTTPDIVDSVLGYPISGSAQGLEDGKASKKYGWIKGIRVEYIHRSTSDDTGISEGTVSKIFIKRLEPVSYDVTLKVGTQILFDGSKTDGIFVVMAGTNGNAKDGDEHMKYVDCVLRKTQKVLFWSLCVGNKNASRLQMYLDANAKMKAALGDRFIDVLGYLSSLQSFQEFGITPTKPSDISTERRNNNVLSDEELMEFGVVPSTYWRFSYTPSKLVTDNIHMDGLGYTAVAKLIYNRLLTLNWI